MAKEFTVEIFPAADTGTMEFTGVSAVTLIDGQSHGEAPLGNLEQIPSGGLRLVICSPHVCAFTVTPS